MEGGLLRDHYPWIYVIAQHKDAKICDLFMAQGVGERVWQVLARNLND